MGDRLTKQESPPRTPTDGESVPLTAARTSPKSDNDMLAEALACVAWDGTVDMDRLASIEFAHDEATVRRVTDLAASLMDSPARGSVVSEQDSISVGGVDVRNGWTANTLAATRHGGAWRIDVPSGAIAMTNKRFGLYCALCARHKHFSMAWEVSVADMERIGCSSECPMDAGWWIEWKNMWMSRTINALASASGAWAGDEIMRTQNLARALLGLLQARNAKGPLASLGGKEAHPKTAGSSIEPTRLREAIAIVASMPQSIEFSDDSPCKSIGRTDNAVNAVGLLKFIINGAQRVYETQSLYKAVIAPAEYDALRRNAPDGAFQ